MSRSSRGGRVASIASARASGSSTQSAARVFVVKARLPLLWLDWSGARVASVETVLAGDYNKWSLSPDGRRLALEDSYDDNDGDFERVRRIGLVNADGTRFRWTYEQEGGLGFRTSWSPDGRSIAFDCGPDLLRDICVAKVATDSVRNLTDTEDRGEFAGAWSPGGKVIGLHRPRARPECRRR